jgi:hypothetical protein
MSDTIGVATAPPFGPTFYLNSYLGQGIGFQDNSFQVDMYYPWHIVPRESVLFGAIQGAATEYGRGYTNAGLGYRQYFTDYDRIGGLWGWFDFDDTHQSSSGWTRFAMSFESLGKYMDVRANGYVLHNGDTRITTNNVVGTPFFELNNIAMNHRLTTETAFQGADLELGGPIPFLGRYGVYGYAGPYYIHGDTVGEAVGAKGRINVQAADNLAVNVSLQDDKIFGMSTYVNISYTLPNAIPTRWFKPRTVRERLNSMVIRQDRIPILDQVAHGSEVLLNPGGPPTAGNPPNPRAGRPIFIVFVDPNKAPGTGNGTAENPYGSLEQARAANSTNVDLFVIRPRTDATGTNLVMQGTFGLFDYQRVWGTTVAHEINTSRGVFTEPALDSTYAAPLVSNGNITAGGSVFQLANVNEISGLHISAMNSSGTAFGNGISNAAPIVDFNINNNQFTDYVNAVLLMNATGDGSSLGLSANQFVNNTLTGTFGTSVNGFELINGANPAAVAANNNTSTVLIADNTATGNSGDAFNVTTTDPSATINVTFSNNTATGNGNAIHVVNEGGTINYDATGNTITGNSGAGYDVTVADPNAVVNLDIENTTSSGNGTGYQFTTEPGTINLIFNNNTASNNTAEGVHMTAAGGTINVESFLNNTITHNSGNGVWFEANSNAGGGSIIVRNFLGNSIIFNGTSNNGVVLGADPDGVLMTTDGPTTLIDAQIGGNGGAQNNISSNGATTLGGSGVHLFAQNDGQINGWIVNNQISNNVGAGISVESVSGHIGIIGASPDMAGAQPFLINNNILSGNGDAGIYARIRGTGTAGLQITGNEITNTIDGPSTYASGEGIHIRTEDTAFLWMTDIENNFIGVGANGSEGGNLSHGIEIETFGDSKLADSILYPNLSLVNIINNQIEFNGFGTANQADGINFQRNGDSLVDNVVIKTNTLTNNTGNGINLEINGGSLDISNPVPNSPLVVDFQIDSNTTSNNGLNGMALHSSANGDLRALVTNNTINANGEDGINAKTQFFSQVEGTWSTNTITNNGENGVSFIDENHASANSFNVLLSNNTIKGNGLDGVLYTSLDDILNSPPPGGGVGTVNIETNLIKQNGLNGVDVETIGAAVANVNLTDNTIQANGLGGVNMFASDFSVINTNSSGNIITQNGGDGWNLTTAHDSTTSVFQNGFISAVLTDNQITFNSGHGINILNQWDGEIDATINGTVDPNSNTATASNIISNNGLEGIKVENAADLTLSEQTATVGSSNIIRFSVNQTEISGNGTKAQTADDGDGIFILVGTSQFGFVNASVTNNHFSGNANIDFATQSFVATAEPIVTNFRTAGGGINAAFTPDPLARLNLHLTGNVGQEIDVTRPGAFYGGPNQPADAFKSIIGSFDDPNIPDGFYAFGTANDATTRRRNAQRNPNDSFVDPTDPFVTGSEVPAPNDNLYTVGPLTSGPPTPTQFSTLGPPAKFPIGADNDLVNATIVFQNSSNYPGIIRVISATTALGQQITISQAVAPGTPPPPAGQFSIVAEQQSGTGSSTFVTDSGPSVNTFNSFSHVVSDFTNQATFQNLPEGTGDRNNILTSAETPFTYTWAISPTDVLTGQPQPFPQSPSENPFP